MTAKPRLAMYWAAACGGCDIAVINLDEALARLDAAMLLPDGCAPSAHAAGAVLEAIAAQPGSGRHDPPP